MKYKYYPEGSGEPLKDFKMGTHLLKNTDSIVESGLGKGDLTH